jgi:preprotein translocase subunit SecE
MKIFKFAREVKAEMTKVTWPSMKDTRMMTLMVFILVVFFAIYLSVVDIILSGGVRWLLGS